jgi:membrane associated rhomboid family serine protease
MPKDRPSTVIALIGLSVGVFVFELLNGRFIGEFAVVPASLKAAFDNGFGADSVWATRKLFTAIFLHSDEQHLIYNMVFLWAFGFLCSKELGKWTTLFLFLICGAIGNAVQCWLNWNSPVPIIGASGGIMAYEGIYLAIAIRWSLPDPDVWPLAQPVPPARMAAFGVVGFGFDFYSLMSHDTSRVAYGAHIGGFASGFLIAWLITQLYPTSAYYEKCGRRC